MGILPKIQNFRDDETQSFEAWLEGFEDTVNLLTGKILERQRIALLKIHLEGLARHHFDSLTEDGKRSYEKACNSLRSNFPSERCKRLAQKETLNLCQSAQESIGEYADRVCCTVRRATTGEPDSVRKHEMLCAFVRGLNDKFRLSVKSAEPNTFDEALLVAERMEEVFTGEGEVSRDQIQLLSIGKDRTARKAQEISPSIRTKVNALDKQLTSQGPMALEIIVSDSIRVQIAGSSSREKPMKESCSEIRRMPDHKQPSSRDDMLQSSRQDAAAHKHMRRSNVTPEERSEAPKVTARETIDSSIVGQNKIRMKKIKFMPRKHEQEPVTGVLLAAVALISPVMTRVTAGHKVLLMLVGLAMGLNVEELFKHNFRWSWNPGIKRWATIHFDLLRSNEKTWRDRTYDGGRSNLPEVRAESNLRHKFSREQFKLQTQAYALKPCQNMRESIRECADGICFAEETAKADAGWKHETRCAFTHRLSDKYQMTVKTARPNISSKAILAAMRMEEAIAGEDEFNRGGIRLPGVDEWRVAKESTRVIAESATISDAATDKGGRMKSAQCKPLPYFKKRHARPDTEGTDEWQSRVEPLKADIIVIKSANVQMAHSCTVPNKMYEYCPTNERDHHKEAVAFDTIQLNLRGGKQVYHCDCIPAKAQVEETVENASPNKDQKRLQTSVAKLQHQNGKIDQILVALLIMNQVANVYKARRRAERLLMKQRAEKLFEHNIQWSWNPGIGWLMQAYIHQPAHRSENLLTQA